MYIEIREVMIANIRGKIWESGRLPKAEIWVYEASLYIGPYQLESM